MKGILILVIFSLIGKLSNANLQECNIEELGKRIPYPGNCEKYITCIDGGKVMDCPDHLHFNADLDVCDLPELAGCGKSDKDKNSDKSNADKDNGNSGEHHNDKYSDGKLHPQCMVEKLGKRIPYPGNCEKYITCIGGGKVMDCPDHLHFNAELEVCDWADRAGCGSKFVSDKDKNTDKSKGDKDDGNSGEHHNDKYSDGKLHPQCMVEKLGKRIPYPGNCEKYITCIGGGKVMDCPDHLHFNAELDVCDWPERAGCGKSDSDKDKNSDKSNTDKDNGNSGEHHKDKYSDGKLYPQCMVEKLGKRIPYSGNCEKYITCIGGGKVMDCPDHLHFNADLDVCDLPELAGCGKSDKDKNSDKSNADKDNGNSGEHHKDKYSDGKLHPQCMVEKLGKRIPYPGNCEKYITCIGGGKVMDCPDHLHFNAELEVCDWADRAGCGSKFDSDKDRNTDESNADKDNVISGEHHKDKDSDGNLHPQCIVEKLGKRIPYPGNCEKYITCIGGGKVMDCPDHLHFNAELNVCDWPERAGCILK